MMSDHQRETAFLRQCILYDDTAERHKLDERLNQCQRDERCVRCAVWLMALLTALAVAGLCYSAVFLADFPQNKSHLMIKVFGALGLAALISLLTFAGFWVVHRKELDQRREECRRLAARLMESRLGKPCTMPLPGVVKDRENVVNGSEAVVSASKIVTLPGEESLILLAAGHARQRAVGSENNATGDLVLVSKQTSKRNSESTTDRK